MSPPPLLLSCFLALAHAQSPEAPEAEAHARQSYSLAQQGQLPESEKQMQEAIRLAPNNPLYHSALAGLFLKDGKLNSAEEELEEALQHDPSPAVRAQLAERLKQVDLSFGAQLAQKGQYRDGVQIAANAAERFPHDARVLQMLGYFQSKLQLNRDAVRSYSRALELDPASSEASVGLGAAQFAAGWEDESVRTLEAGLARFPDDVTHYQALGVVLVRMSEGGRDTKARARSLFEKALRIDNTLPEAHYELGTMALTENDIGSAKNHLLASERSAPNDSRVHFALARLYRMQGEAQASDREMRAFLAAKPAERPERAAVIEAGGP
jgi:Flp pilus assembly protein TadD